MIAPTYSSVLNVEMESNQLSSILSLQHSYREVGILLLYLAVGVSVFSGIAYTAEYEEVELEGCLFL